MEKRKYREGGNKTVKRKAVGHGKIQRDKKSKLCIEFNYRERTNERKMKRMIERKKSENR